MSSGACQVHDLSLPSQSWKGMFLRYKCNQTLFALKTLQVFVERFWVSRPGMGTRICSISAADPLCQALCSLQLTLMRGSALCSAFEYRKLNLGSGYIYEPGSLIRYQICQSLDFELPSLQTVRNTSH